jgi:hypothetical protein
MFKKILISLFIVLISTTCALSASVSLTPSVNTQTLGTVAKPWAHTYSVDFISPKVADIAGLNTRYQGTGSGVDYVGEIGSTTMSTDTSYLLRDPAAVPTIIRSVQTVDGSSRTGSGTAADPWIYAKSWTPLGITVEVDGHTTNTNLTAANVSNTIIYNNGQAASDVYLNLPTAAAGYSALFTVYTAQAYKWGVKAGASDKIYLLASDGTVSVGSDNGYARMTQAQAGQCFACWTFKTDAYDWMCKAVSIGTSTFAAN